MRNILITGCSTGIGEACAHDLASRSIRVFAGVRKEEDGQRLREAARGQIEPVLLDVTDEAGVGKAAATIRQSLQELGVQGLDGLVNNAGIIVPGPWELVTTDQLRRQFEVNVFGTHRVTRHFLPLLRPVRGRVILMGSISGVVTPPFMGAYASSKHALESLADGLRVELGPWKLPVSLIEPDSVSTPIWDKMIADTFEGTEFLDEESRQVYVDQLEKVREAARAMGDTGMPVERVVRAVRHALLSRWPRPRYPVGFRTRLAIWAYANLPNRWFDWFMAQAMGLR
jgi:NAD(P)-dependent dehydrogenase (short-subunit alcohol dehydrogenase family)